MGSGAPGGFGVLGVAGWQGFGVQGIPGFQGFWVPGVRVAIEATS